MKLINLIDYNSKTLVHCSLCEAERPWNLASKEGWVLDADRKGTPYYCQDCKSFLINKLDSTNEI